MSNLPVVHAVLYEWHANGTSEAAFDTLVHPLQQWLDLRLHPVEWRSRLVLPGSFDGPWVFFFVPPPGEFLATSRHSVTWIPMWDQARKYSERFWRRLPRHLRIVSFSNALSARTRAAGLQTLDVRYYRDPQTLPPTRWEGERVAFYWNRAGLVGPRFLERWCAAVGVDRLLFKAQMDPFLPKPLAYTLPNRLGRTLVEPVPHLPERTDYFRRIELASMFLAPRPYEGIGMTYLEALARGNAVFAADGPTMNEYIDSGTTGYLFRRRHSPPMRALSVARRKLRYRGVRLPLPIAFELHDDQPWADLSRLDLPALGAAARAAHVQGHQAWLRAIPEYAAFVAGG